MLLTYFVSADVPSIAFSFLRGTCEFVMTHDSLQVCAWKIKILRLSKTQQKGQLVI